MTDTIAPFAAVLAAAEQTHAERAKEATEAQEATDALRTRANAVAARREAVKADLGADKLDARAAGALLALADEDAADLQKLISESEARQTAAETAQADAQSNLDRAREQLAKAEAAERFNLLTARAAELDRVLMNCVVELAAMGRAAGKGNDLASLWRPSERMRQAILLRAVPRVEQAA